MHGQDQEDIMISVQGDLVKTDYLSPFQKAQLAAEVHYFALPDFTASSGFEVWTGDEVSFLIGMRWYPSEGTFLRLRGLIGENDVSIGGGWTVPIIDRVQFEAIGDFYFSVDFAIRCGFTYTIQRNQ
jgi:hypothetical protein